MSMHTYQVKRPPSRRADVLETMAVLIVTVGFMAAAYRPFSAIAVTVEGRPAEAVWGMTLGEVAASGLTSAAPGDLVAADDGSVLATGAGRPVSVRRGGAPARASARVYPGDDLAFIAGADVAEATVTTETLTEPPPVEIGAGPIVEVVDEGQAGRSLVTVGAVSGHVVSETVLARARPACIVRSGGTGGVKVVALTFDDGPWPGQTERVLDVLARYDVKATFFMLGANAAKYRGLARRVTEEGHQVGNHTWSHRTAFGTPWRVSMAEIKAAQDAIRASTGVTPRWFRPPKGTIGPSLADAAKAHKLRVAMWTVDPWDWDRPGVTAITQRTLAQLRPGGVVLLHDGGGDRTQTVYALEAIVRELRRQGYTFVTLDELAEIRQARGR